MSCVLLHFVRNPYPLQVWKVEQKGRKKNQLLAFSVAALATKPQNLDTGGKRKKTHLSLGHHSRQRIAYFFFPPLFHFTPVSGSWGRKGDWRYANTPQSFMETRNIIAGCISLTLLQKKRLFKTFLTQRSSDKRAVILIRKARMCYIKKPI